MFKYLALLIAPFLKIAPECCCLLKNDGGGGGT